MAAELRELGFPPSYDVEVNPEFPPSGNWGVTEIRVGGDSPEPLVIKVSPNAGDAWVAFFACGGISQKTTRLTRAMALPPVPEQQQLGDQRESRSRCSRCAS